MGNNKKINEIERKTKKRHKRELRERENLDGAELKKVEWANVIAQLLCMSRHYVAASHQYMFDFTTCVNSAFKIAVNNNQFVNNTMWVTSPGVLQFITVNPVESNVVELNTFLDNDFLTLGVDPNAPAAVVTLGFPSKILSSQSPIVFRYNTMRNPTARREIGLWAF